MKNSGILLILLVVILVLAIGGGAFYFLKSGNSLLNNSTTVKSSSNSGYVGVFLSNNQVYFGKLANENSQYVTLTDVYYLRVVPSQQEIESADIKVEDKKKLSSSSATPATTTTTKNELTLVKLGSEIHGPDDEIKINRDNILYTENLKEEGKVVKAIKDYQIKQK